MKKPDLILIPPEIRYCKTLPAAAKILYGEIEFLCKQEGHCWASNSYFAKLFHVHPMTISAWVKTLKKHDYITTKILKNKRRKIYIKQPIEKSIVPYIEKPIHILKGHSPLNSECPIEINNNNKDIKDKQMSDKVKVSTTITIDNKGVKHKESILEYPEGFEGLLNED